MPVKCEITGDMDAVRCPMCGEVAVVDGYCCLDHREIHRHQTEAAKLRNALLEIIQLGEDGSWYVELARAAHLGTART